jgi:hypothetical protein
MLRTIENATKRKLTHEKKECPMKINYVQDPGHGWFEISPDQQNTLNLSQSNFSEFSYISENGTIYAEEDCDYAYLFKAAQTQNIKLEINEIVISGEAFIRSLPRC